MVAASCTKMQACGCAVLQNLHPRLLISKPVTAAVPNSGGDSSSCSSLLPGCREVDAQLVASVGNVAATNASITMVGSEGAISLSGQARLSMNKKMQYHHYRVMYVEQPHTSNKFVSLHVPNQ